MNTLFVTALAFLTHWFDGSLGWAIVALSLGSRVALLPLTVRLARRAQRNQGILRQLQPELDVLRKKFEKKPERFFREAAEIYRKHDCRPFDLPVVLGAFIQLPVFGMLYKAIRSSLVGSGPFLWIRSLAGPDFALTLLVLAMTGLSAHLMPGASENGRAAVVVIQVLFTAFIVWKLAAGLGLYWASSNLVGLFQTLWLRLRIPDRAGLAA